METEECIGWRIGRAIDRTALDNCSPPWQPGHLPEAPLLWEAQSSGPPGPPPLRRHDHVQYTLLGSVSGSLLWPRTQALLPAVSCVSAKGLAWSPLVPSLLPLRCSYDFLGSPPPKTPLDMPCPKAA